MTAPLVVIDMQRIFGEPQSPWFAPRFAEASAAIESLIPAFGSGVAYTRFLAPTEPTGVWRPYYRMWPFALDPANAGLYALVQPFGSARGADAAQAGRETGRDSRREGDAERNHRLVVDRTTFGKWGHELAELTRESGEMVLTGVSTDCCVLSTALAAADAGVHVRVVADACAGVSDADHQRALDVMALYAPLIEITTASEVLAGLRSSGPRVADGAST